MLNERKKKILQIIIEDYISSAEPVGSRTIARKYDLGLSPATIRNEMSDLELLGYLEQPHTSAGRIPSAQAYRFYVDALIEPGTLTDNDMALIDGWYNERVSMVLTNQQTIANFCYLKFLPLDSQHAILCIVADDGSIDTNVIDIPLGMSSEEMDYLAGKMSKLLEDRNLSDISVEILQTVHTDVVEDKLIFSSLLQAVRKMTGRRQEQKVFLGGTKQLLNQPEFRDVERVRNLLGILEEEKVLKDLLQGGEDSGLKVTIGSENKFTGIQDCSMVQATYRLNGQIVGTMAVLGPTRMEYGKVISVMDYLHKYLKTILDK